MEDFEGLQFVAKLEDWACVKKLKIEKGMQAWEIAEFLISLSMSANKKAEDFLAKEIDFEAIKKAIESCEEPLKALEHASVKKVVKDALKNRASLDNATAKALEELAYIYAVRYALKKAGFKIDYFEAELPSLKLAKKLSKKVK